MIHKGGFPFKKSETGNSLVVQWLGLRALTARSPRGSLVGELRSRKPRDAAEKINR